MIRTLSLIVLPLIAAIAVACGGTAETEPSPDGDTTATATATAAATIKVTATPEPTATSATANSTRETPERLILISAVENTALLQTYRFQSEITISRLAAIPVNVSSVSFTVTGAFDPVNNRAEMSFDFTDMVTAIAASTNDPAAASLLQEIFGSEPLQLRHIEGVAYLSGPLISALLDVQTNWISFPADLDQSARSLGAIGLGQFNSQADLLAFLHKVYGVDEVGPETVRGVDTTHYRGVISLNTLLTQLHPEDVTQIEASLAIDLADHLGDAPIDIWIDDEGIIRRILLVTDFSDYGGVGRYTEETVGAITLLHEVYDVGEAILIEDPPFGDITPVDDTFLEGAAALSGEAPAS